jgi:hypothetical protein
MLKFQLFNTYLITNNLVTDVRLALFVVEKILLTSPQNVSYIKKLAKITCMVTILKINTNMDPY